MLPKLAGRYIANPLTWAVGEHNGLPIFDMMFSLSQFADPLTGWGVAPSGMEIRKRFFLKKTDGSWSEHALTSLVESLGWDGTSLKSLAAGQWSSVEVQLEIDYEDKNGKSYIGVKFMNPRDYAGHTLASDPVTVQSLEAKYGGELKAMAAGKPKPVKSAASTKTTAAVDHKAAAWNEFKQRTPAMTADQRTAAWSETVLGYSGKSYKDPKVDWQHVANSIVEHGVYKAPALVPEGPPDDAPAIAEDDIPF